MRTMKCIFFLENKQTGIQPKPFNPVQIKLHDKHHPW